MLLPVRSAVATLVVAAAALATLTGCSPAGTPAPDEHPSFAPTAPPTPVPSAFSTAVPRAAATVPPVPTTAAPTRIAVDWAGVSAAVRPEGVDDQGAMALPSDPSVAGWYRFGAAPSQPAGTVVIAAHVDAVGYGVGPFAHLQDVPDGTTVTITDATGAETRWRIASVSMIAKRGLPWSSVFRTDGPRRLVLVTCGGAFDTSTHHYESNLVITAVPV
ncbi:class F sortase [Curtobacterium pusillum]|uniref:class F sortase n=1 Tax=Curtobacterium pusillum TaxID=69373 RepID=UPI0011A918CB|nr:class F sortase [Curtobacterium pusillum]